MFNSTIQIQFFKCNLNRGMVKGMGIPEGITVIAGGGFHGYEKNLLLLLSNQFHICCNPLSYIRFLDCDDMTT